MAIKLKDVPTEEHLHRGNLACAACPEVLGFRHVLKMLGPNTIVINGTGCLAVVMQMAVPKVPHFHVLFENAPAVISGIDDALRVMGINPIRFLVVPSLVAMVVMLPALVVWANFLALLGAGLYITSELGIGMGAYLDQTIAYLDVGDVTHGLAKSLIFGVLITIVGVVNGASVRGGAEGVGRVTTNSVVHAITAIVVTDMIFVYVATR